MPSPLGTSDLDRVRTTANAWAAAKGFADAGVVPTKLAATMIHEVAAQTQVDAAAVRDALLGEALATLDTLADIHDGAPDSTPSATEHRPLVSQSGMRPLGVRLQSSE